MNAQTQESTAKPSIRYSTSERIEPTDASQPPARSPFRSKAALRTEPELVPSNDVQVLRAANQFDVSKPVVQFPQQQQPSVEGIVVSFDSESVECELTLAVRKVRIQLPRDLFSHPPRFGMPMALRMVDDDRGFRKAEVLSRVPRPGNEMESIRENIASLLGQL